MTTVNPEKSTALTTEEIRRAALNLPIEDRESLTRDLVTSIEEESSEIDQSWIDEVMRRLDRYERGETTPIDHDEVMRTVQQNLDAIDAARKQ